MKKSIGFVISHKENENRRALIPCDIKNIRNKKFLYFEKGYGECLNIPDNEYTKLGCQIVTREEALKKDIICDPKIGDAEYLANLSSGQAIFGWVHAVQNKDITDLLVNNKLSAYAWEDMYDNGRHSYWRNNEIAGEAAVMHAFQLLGILPYDTNVAIIGRGNTAMGAFKILTNLGANVKIYNKNQECLLKKELFQYDVIINAILWDTTRKDHIIYKKDLCDLKPGAMIIDVSCDEKGAIETSVPTTFNNPTYIVQGIIHYVVDHTPSLFYKSSTKSLSSEVSKYVDVLIDNTTNNVINNALIIENGDIKDEKILKFQNK